ncbi:hypothetical protein E5K00_03790 [Hymenobacter aquaticus]|uniref:Uncharacterized protein n=1 Tax=Hymenobacter aquaticus TaxID=1867101 RepID=A0A4Z0Q2T9_9BACT|nr:hypothetical protein [Hymenobacter aquaticus]TGE24347.1 hypothetical protein E5K00_03790 [Hymenobacter aquaticus]
MPTIQPPTHLGFQIIYDGPSLREGLMDTRDLAPALLALSNLVEQINHRLSHDNPPVHLHFRAAKRGSLTINLDLQTIVAQEATPLFAGNDTQSLGRILDVLWDSGHTVGLFQLLKFLRGQAPQDVERTSLSTVTVYNAFGGKALTSALTLQLATDTRVKQDVARVVHPLEREGITSFVLRRQVGEAITPVPITQEDVPAFAVQAPDNSPTEDTSTTLLQIVRPDLSDATPRWEVTDGTSKFNARVTDEVFAERVRTREVTFGHNDAIRAELTRRQYRTERGALRTEYEISRVLNHYPGGVPTAQLPLFEEVG